MLGVKSMNNSGKANDLYNYLNIYKITKSMLKDEMDKYFTSKAYDSIKFFDQCKTNNDTKKGMERCLYNTELANRNIVRVSPTHSKAQEIAENKEKIAKIIPFMSKNTTKQTSLLFASENYGNINMNIIHKVYMYTKDSVDYIIHRALKGIQERDFFVFYDEVQPSLLYEGETMQESYLHLLWYYAIREPENTQKFEECIRIYKVINKIYCIDFLLGELYVLGHLQKKNDIATKVKLYLEYIHVSKSPKDLTSLASLLNYLKMPDSEYEVLCFMKKNNLQLTEQVQKRFFELENMDKSAPTKQEVSNTINHFYMDTSSINWHEKDYEGFFNNLNIQKDILNYHLVIRDDHQHITLNKIITLPENEVICGSLNKTFDEEYGDIVKAKMIKGEIITNGIHTPIEGHLVLIDEYPQLGIFLHMIKLGKKINITFYTLYISNQSSPLDQKKSALSIFMQSTPTITAWEESLKDSILLTLQNLLNKRANIETTNKQNNQIIF